MTRNRTEANRRIFSFFDSYCRSQDSASVIDNEGAPRWIKTEEEDRCDRGFLTESICLREIAFSPRRVVSIFDFDNGTYFFVVGFQWAESNDLVGEVALTGGMLSALLCETPIRPIASISEIRNIVGGLDANQDSDYEGHDKEDIKRLFPTINVFSAENIDELDHEKIVFSLCLDEVKNGDSWIGEELSDYLYGLCSLDVLNIPYKTLSRSIFDADESSLFLALYRCLEALYAYSAATALSGKLGLNQDWPEVAVALEDTLGWYPRESDSLTDLMKHAVSHDLNYMLTAVGQNPDEYSGENRHAGAARHIYKLRNSLVHYRPAHQHLDYQEIDWTLLCCAMASSVAFIYYEVFD